MTPEVTASAGKAAVNELGGAFSECPKTLRRARQLGLSGWAFYVAGRGGALGDVRPDTVAAALGFVAPEAVADGWDAARRVLPPAEIATQTLLECCRWGEEHLSAYGVVARLVDLAERVVLSADASALPLFAAWRAMPVPRDSPGARAAVLLHLLREHRGGAHLVAIRAAGLAPKDAILAGPDGEAGAVALGWQPPFRPVGPLLRRWLWAEAVTDRLAGEAYATLDRSERTEFVGLLDAALARHRDAAPA